MSGVVYFQDTSQVFSVVGVDGVAVGVRPVDRVRPGVWPHTHELGQ